MPNGANILPSIPERKKRGTKLATIIRVEFKIGIRTSLEASKTTVRTFFLFLFSFLPVLPQAFEYILHIHNCIIH